MPELASDLHEKVLLVYLRKPGHAMRAGIGLVNPKLEEYWGEPFLTGLAPVHQGDWSSRLVTAVRWAEVAHFLVFDSLAEYQVRVRNAEVMESSGLQGEN